MTNLTSEQYRDILKHVPECTEEIPTIQHLLRRAVQTFFKRFRGYPELAGVAPGKVGIFGDQTQFSDGLALPAATPMATIIVGRRSQGNRYTVVTSADVGKPHKVTFSISRNRPLEPGCPVWLNYVKGAIDSYEDDVPPFEAAIESSVPMGVGFGSSSAIEVAVYSFLELLVGKKSDPIGKAKALQKAERKFANKNVGLVDRITSILAKDRHAMLIDCKTNEVTWIPFQNSKVAIVAVDSHLKDSLFGDEYPERTKYLAKACEILGVESLRNCTEDDLTELENKVQEILSEGQQENEEENEEGKSEPEVWTKEEYDTMIKRARFFIKEMIRIDRAVEALNEGDVETFGEKMKESHDSLKEDFEFNNPVLDFLVETSLEVEGVLGSRMTGMGLGFGGGIVSLVNKENIETYCNYIREKFEEYESQLSNELKGNRQKEKDRQNEVKKKFHSEHFNPSIASSEIIGHLQEYLESGGALKKVSPKRTSLEAARRVSAEGTLCLEKLKIPCIVKVEKPPGGCGTWARFQKERQKEEYFRKKSLEEEEAKRDEKYIKRSENSAEDIRRSENSAEVSRRSAKRAKRAKKSPKKAHENENESAASSTVSDVQVKAPSFYIVSPFAGARMMFVTKTDILRSRFATPLPHPKALVRSAMKEFEATYGNKVEAIGLAPATVCLFGEFMEFHLGYIITMALPLYVVTVGGRNDTVFFSVKTTSEDVEKPTDMKHVIPCVRTLEVESRSWVNFVMGVVNEFKGHVPGFNAVVHSNIPIRIGLNSCSGLQSAMYNFIETLTRQCTTDPFEKMERCAKSEYEFLPTPTELVTRCSNVKFLPVFLSKEGHLMLINCKKYKTSHYFFDSPEYAFVIACCKKTTNDVTIASLEERLKKCMDALEILEKLSLLNLDAKHLRCLKKREADEEMIKRTRYIITEHQRITEVIKAVQEEDYARVGLLMNQSHESLRDDYEVSSPEIESLIELARSVEGVLGAKMLGKGLNTSVIILVKISDADKCIRYMRKNYKDKTDKPVFYITKPTGGAFAMSPDVDVPYIL